MHKITAMKSFRFLFLLMGTALLMSCSSVRVLSDYDTNVNFNQYRSYAFYKTGIDKAQISDLDKKRILKAIESEMAAKGFVKSEDPDLLVSIFTTEKERVDVYNNNFGWGWGPGWGWGWNPWIWGGPGWYGPSVSTRTEGALFIDLIDAKRKELVWQGRGSGTLGNMQNIEKKEARIREFVTKIMEEYPPQPRASTQ